MSKLYFCETHYNSKPPIDINPLILQRYKNNNICALCAREGTKIRINKLRNLGLIPNVKGIYGIWELKYEDFLLENGCLKDYIKNMYDVFVVIGKNRVYKEYSFLLKKITNAIKCY